MNDKITRMPIGKFEWREDIEQERDLLGYVAIADYLYIPDFDYANDDPYMHEAFTVTRFTPEEATDMEDVKVVPCIPDVSETLQTFADRYNQNLIAEHFNYDGYMKNATVQRLVKELGLDADKFWMLLLFVYDYSLNQCIQGTGIGESPNEQLEKFVNTVVGNVVGNVKGFDEVDGSTFARPVVIKISVAGGRDVVIDNPTAIHYIADLTLKMMEHDNVGSIGVMARKRVLEEPSTTADSPFIAFFAQMFLDFFDTQRQVVGKRKKGAKHSQRETDLVCQLIAFTRLSTSECWKLEKNDTLKAFLRQYKDFKPGTRNSVYPQFRMY